ncbi:MAG: type II secretion system protein GspM [Pseudohongiella sp.]|nr:type II secretion system protein GspM [Pseudohongiella sp.]MDO9520751.1 type II secretion system protein GspM [Pseudohongiella sp.]MDP2126964.1 type II secretion system protein GspM [Pseudohongiella sp.]
MKNLLHAISGNLPARYLMRYSQREQLLLLLCGFLVLATVLWLTIWQPVMAARSASEARLAYAAVALEEVNMLAAELEYLRQSSVNPDVQADAAQSLPQLLNSLAAQSGIVVASLEPAADNRSAGVRFDAVAMPDLLAWLAELESQTGIQLEQLTIAPVSSNRVAGNQSVNATLRVRSLP